MDFSYSSRTYARTTRIPDIDSVVFVHARDLHAGQLLPVKITDYQAYDLIAKVPTKKDKSLPVLARTA